MRRLGGGLALALVVGVLGGAPARAGEAVTLTAEEMRAFGQAALTGGFADQAIAVAEALLTRDAGDSLALVLKAQALRLKGALAESEAAARAAWRLADTPAERYAAATALAQALSLQDKRTRAQFWLRQAVQNAPNPATRAQALQDFGYVRDQNPLRLRFDLSLRPSNNVNGGARDPIFEYQGIPFLLSGDALALSGLAWGAGVQGSWSLSASPRAETLLTFAMSHQGVVLSDEARIQAPEARNADYALSNLEAGVTREVVTGLGTLTGGLTAGHSWYGGADLADSLRLSVELEHALSQSARLTLGTTITRQTRLDRAISSTDEVEGQAGITTRGAAGDSWRLGLTLGTVSSDDAAIDHDEAMLTVGWQAGKPLAGMDLGAELSARLADYGPGSRKDRRISASLSATLREMTYLGFAPVLSLDLSRNDSNLGLYSTETAGLSLSIASRF